MNNGNDFKDFNLENMNEDDIYYVYSEISDELEKQKIIWDETKDYEREKMVYSKYVKKDDKV